MPITQNLPVSCDVSHSLVHFLVASVLARSPRFHAAGNLESNGADEDICGRWHRPDSAGTEGWRYDVRFGAHRARGTFRNITS